MRGRSAWAAIVAVSLLFFSGCNRERGNLDDGAGCIADSIRTLQLLPTVPSCATDKLLCGVQCKAGNAASCIGLAYETQKDPDRDDEALRLYRRACLLGAANGCTNYAATIWAGAAAGDELPCVRRVFEKACAAKEPFACGMVGRLMLENTTAPSYADARQYLERSCNEVGGFSCRVLAKHLESGKLGKYDPASIPTLLRKACADGDPDACGEPATAAETFH